MRRQDRININPFILQIQSVLFIIKVRTSNLTLETFLKKIFISSQAASRSFLVHFSPHEQDLYFMKQLKQPT